MDFLSLPLVQKPPVRSFIKASPSGGLAVADYFAPSNTIEESEEDLDLGSGAPMLLPDVADASGNVWHLAVGAGKDGNLYIVNLDSMGKFNAAGDNIYEEIQGIFTPYGVYGTPVYFNQTVYLRAVGTPIGVLHK